MNRHLARSASILLVFLGLSPSSRAHGGTYTGPGDTVPAGGGGGGGGGAPPAAPGSSGGAPGAPTGAGGVGPRGTGVSTGTITGRPNVQTGPATTGPEITTWEFWWGFNQSPYLRLKAAIHNSISTESDIFFLSPGERSAPKDLLKPSETTIRQEIVPALKAALATERANDIVTGCLIALAKIGDVKGEDGVSELEPLIAKFLPDGNQEIAETAAVALGILGSESSVGLLADLANDAPRARERVGNREVHQRTRAFAIYGLGLVGSRTSSDRLRREIAGILIDLLEKPESSTRDLKVAALVSLGLVPIDVDASGAPEARQHFASSRQSEIRFVANLFRDDSRDVLVRAHAPAALARLLPGAPPAQKTEVAKLLLAPLAPNAGARTEIEQACVLALGQVGDADSDPIDVEIRAALLRVAADGRDLQSKGFAMISLGQVGGAVGSGDCAAGVQACRTGLLDGLTRGKANVRTWAAIGIGVLEHALEKSDRGQALRSSVAQDAVRSALKDAKEPSAIGAYAIACGLARDAESKVVLRERLGNVGPDDARGNLAVALGLVQAREAVPEIQAVIRDSKYRPELLRQAAIGLGLLGDKDLVPDLVKMLAEAKGFSSQAAIASALGFIGDSRSVAPLIAMLRNASITESARGFAAVALGIVADREPLPWNSRISVNIDYRANTATLTTPEATGILDLL